ncbi:hypothetical protein [Wenjunlia tyrosinilytica]|uniref:Uncharacterized protein n=1 Tax=Wenjunlia tyrosinilytica TaxID=1544741 RepID=A0A917ZSF9_9ACTN|nr:hypothetical protein [Wenjunlia tyrosinilytica]GGO90342.1 hypothetical protein GCM10012280_35650 [Wenjunlia tyrosinilytica]
MRLTRVLGALTGSVLLAAGLAAVPGTAEARAVVPCDLTALVNAIDAANTAGGGSLALAPLCTYTLSTVDNDSVDGANGLPVITTNISITGALSTIERSSAPGTPDFRIFQIDPPDGNLTLTGVTVRNGRAEPGQIGGGIWLHDGGTLHVVNSTITNNVGSDSGGGDIGNNTATAASGVGGGILNASTLNVTTSQLVDNTAGGASSRGGGLFNSGTATFQTSLVRSNHANDGGGIFNSAGLGAVTLALTPVILNTPNNCAPTGSVAGC